MRWWSAWALPVDVLGLLESVAAIFPLAVEGRRGGSEEKWEGD
jgi:hypothetical protein